MELHPILEKDLCPNTKLWYVLSAIGDCPSIRVGHTCTFIRNKDGGNGKVYVIGGANPSGCFNDTYVLDLETFSWDTVDSTGFCSRYEHAAFVAESQPDKIYVFGGANQSGNLNDIQMLDTVTGTWSTVSVKGDPPSARTFHTSACVGDRFIVYSGGQSGADPVGDRQVHCFDASSTTWMVLSIKGDPPKPRHGHVMVAVGNKVFLHGGMSGTTFYDDLHVLDLIKNTWSSVKQKKDHPCSRAAHGGIGYDGCVYVFGGMNKDGALADIYKLDAVSMKWTEIDYQGPPPASRLDFAMCSIERRFVAIEDEDLNEKTQEAKSTLEAQIDSMKIGDKGQSEDTRAAASSHSEDQNQTETQPKTATDQDPSAVDVEGASGGTTMQNSERLVPLCFITGGMDTEGEIFEDCMVIMLE